MRQKRGELAKADRRLCFESFDIPRYPEADLPVGPRGDGATSRDGWGDREIIVLVRIVRIISIG